MKVMLEHGAKMPAREHARDAGLDLFANEGASIPSHSAVTIRTGVHVQLPHGTAGLLVSKSGLNSKMHITTTGLIDEGYRGEIQVTMHNHGNAPFIVAPGQKISQLVIIPVLYEECEKVYKLDESPDGRGEDGFGSTGRF